MGQAKNRQAEIAALKAAGPKVKPNKPGFMPDAGLNSSAGLNHYWFQVSELIQHLYNYPKKRSYEMRGERHLELNVPVDIMDREGVQHLAPQSERGYFATFRFSTDQLWILSDSIARGAMSVRIDGVPAEVETAPSGERFQVIDVCDSWSAGNDIGLMTYYVLTNQGMIGTDSTKLATRLREIRSELKAL